MLHTTYINQYSQKHFYYRPNGIGSTDGEFLIQFFITSLVQSRESATCSEYDIDSFTSIQEFLQHYFNTYRFLVYQIPWVYCLLLMKTMRLGTVILWLMTVVGH